MDITWTTKYHGRAGELAKLHSVSQDYTKSRFIRKQAYEAKQKILAQLQDKKLMAMRDRLIKAALAGDEAGQALIQQEMKYYLHEDQETGLYGQK